MSLLLPRLSRLPPHIEPASEQAEACDVETVPCCLLGGVVTLGNASHSQKAVQSLQLPYFFLYKMKPFPLSPKSFSSHRFYGHHKSLSLPLSPKARPIPLKRKALNSSHSSSSSTVTSPRLTALRSRKSSAVVSPDLNTASQVVTQYIIPMFEAESQIRGDISRSQLFGTSKTMKSLDPIPGTIYGELKLSENLGRELANLKGEMLEMGRKLKEAEQKKESVASDLRHERERNVELETSLKDLRLHYTADLRKLQVVELTEAQLRQQLLTLQVSFSQLEESHKANSSLLQAQYAKIDKLRNKGLEQEHINSLLLMENDIIGERLKGLYFAIQGIAQVEFLKEKLSAELEITSRTMRQFSDFADSVDSKLRATLFDRDAVQADNFELVNLRNDTRFESEKLARLSKEKIGDLMQALQKSEDDREKQRTKMDEAEKTLKGLTEEYEKLRQKAKQYRLRRKQYGEEEEKVCKNCQRVYIESENFNWSCRRHQNEYSGEIYWCCGKSHRDAPGCKTSKHESKEDDEEEEVNKEAANETSQKCSVSAM